MAGANAAAVAGRGEGARDDGRVGGRDEGREIAPVARGEDARDDAFDDVPVGRWVRPVRGDGSREVARDVATCDVERGDGLRDGLRDDARE